jgi:hypothetical protein
VIQILNIEKLFGMKKIYLLLFVIVSYSTVFTQTPKTVTFTYQNCITDTVIIRDTVFIHETKYIYETEFIRDTIDAYRAEYTSNSECYCDLKNCKLNVYPNPTEDNWTVEVITNVDGILKVQLSDAIGKIVYLDKKMLTRGKYYFVINGRSFQTGVYHLKIKGAKCIFVRALIKK